MRLMFDRSADPLQRMARPFAAKLRVFAPLGPRLETSLLALRPFWLMACVLIVGAVISVWLWDNAKDRWARLHESRVAAVSAAAEERAAAIEQLLSSPILRVAALQSLARTLSSSIEAGDPKRAAEGRHDLDTALSMIRSGVIQVSATDLSGRLLWSNLPIDGGPVDVSDREHIRAILKNGAENFVSTPVLGRVSGEKTVQFSAAVRDEAGRLRGASVVSVKADMLQYFSAGIQIGANDVTALVRSDGAVLMSAVGANSSNTAFPEYMPVPFGKLHDGKYVTVCNSVRDGRLRAYAIRRLAGYDYDLAIVAGIDMQQAQGTTAPLIREEKRQLVALIALTNLSMILAAVMLLLIRAWLVAEIIRRAKLATEARLSEIVAVAPGVLLCARLEGHLLRVTKVDGGLGRMLGNLTAPSPADVMLNAALAELPTADLAMCFQKLRSALEVNVDVPIRLQHESGADDPRKHWLRLYLRPRPASAAVSSPESAGVNDLDLVGFVTDVTAEREAMMVMQESSRLMTLGEMAANLAHELSQPLTMIAMAASNGAMLLEASSVKLPKVLEKFDKILSRTQRAAGVLDHMRVFAHAAPGSRGVTSISDALTSATEMLYLRLQQVQVVINSKLEPNLPMVLGDTIPVEQVMINLINNAIDAYLAAPNALRIVEIDARRSGNNVILEIADHAGGVPEAVIGRIFEPFVTTKSAGAGVGVGLSLCRGLIEKMGGQITVANRNDGAVFTISLPAWIPELAASS